jgi:uncharacterized protein (TIGR02266 family)
MTMEGLQSSGSLNPSGGFREDKRKTTRSDLESNVTCKIEGQTFVGLSKDISRGGMFVQCLTPVLVGNTLNLEFTLPNMSLPMNLEGRVVWIREEKDEFGENRPVGFGVVFQWKYN